MRFYLSALYGKLQFLLRSISHRPLYLLRYLVWFFEADAPIQKEPELHLHGMDACLGNDETALWHDLQFIRGYERPRDHLHGLRWFVLALRDRS